MKLEPRRIEAFLREPGAVRMVLLHGDEQGLIAERGMALVRLVAGAVDDPFRVVGLARESWSTLPDEMRGLSLTGGRRVIHVRDATDALSEPVRLALSGNGDAFAVIESGSLPPRSKLRALIEAASDAAAIACYPDDAAAAGRVLRAALEEGGVSADDDTVSWLFDRLGGDRGVMRQEAEKLALYVGPGRRADLDAARACVADQGLLSLDDALYASTAGDAPGADRALRLAIGEGAAPVQLVRGALLHVQRLHRARLAMAKGLSATEAAKAERPPIFYKRLPAFTRAATTWNQGELDAAARRLQELERACKRTGAPAETLSRQAILSIAQRGASLARR